ncbi:hypothetical protein OG978_03250 [Streptomyces sp. NBC_01591]|uniref:hypothetical protein n=1 Tax=Streptomyces sp. NBC_01591 TaxID=2975888 RepID=UPI002DD911BC|nr:hypothetical protein [Streptomyces sp. NBC_01591]WSD66488.1 hypothetical protein OG978_03250 [Streptomyces sp. NBC_01591]
MQRRVEELYSAAGAPSPRRLEKLSGVSRSPLHRTLQGSFPRSAPVQAVETADALLSPVEPAMRKTFSGLVPVITAFNAYHNPAVRLAGSELTVDDGFVRLMRELQDTVHEALGLLNFGTEPEWRAFRAWSP